MGDEGDAWKSSMVAELGILSGQSVLAWSV